MSDYSQKAGLRDGLHDKQQILSSQFIPKHEGVYEFIIETESNVCTTYETPASFLLPLKPEKDNNTTYIGGNPDAKKDEEYGAAGDHNMGQAAYPH